MPKENWTALANLLKARGINVKDAAKAIGMTEQGFRKAVKVGSFNAYKQGEVADMLNLPLEDVRRICYGDSETIANEPAMGYVPNERIVSATDPHDMLRRLYQQRHIIDELVERERKSRLRSNKDDVAGNAP